MAGATTREFDVADHLNTPEEIAAYLDAVLEEGDDKLLLIALRNVVKSKGFTKVAQGAGLRRETLYQSFSEDGNPRLSTLSGVLGQLGMRLSVTPQAKSA
ncbi:MAG: putative addiction module antidote protein [Desulfurellaceae bacterium]|nr:putative addiction module antidote protein [Desulfurellaceae bacterium]